MKLTVLVLALICAASVSAAEPPEAPAATAGGGEKLPRAFPGAEGFGAYTPGGRGGKVFRVTTLEDYRHKEPPIPGSLRLAILAKEPRMVIFAVSGTIHLKERLRLDSPFVTLAGQTAPGDGICLADQGTSVATHDVILRHMRFRHGDASGNDSDSLWFRNAQNVIVDHCSMSWGLDENFSFTKSTTNVTAQWCLISEGLNPKHHGYGSLIAPDVDCRMSLDPYSYYTLAATGGLKSCGWLSKTRIRRPLCLPRLTGTSGSSPRFTRCMIVWRDTPRMRMAWGMAT